MSSNCSSSPTSKLKRQILSEFYKGHNINDTCNALNNEFNPQQITEWFEALRQERQLFRFREKRCVCWRCVHEVADCCAEPTVKRPRLIQSNNGKIPFLPLYRWSQQGNKFSDGGFDHANYASFDGRFVYDLDLQIDKGLRVIDTFTGKSSLFEQDPTTDYRATFVSLPNFSISTMIFVQQDLAIVTLINDDKLLESNDRIGLLGIQHSSNTFCFVDIRPIDVRENGRGGRFIEYVEMFKLHNDPHSTEWKFGIILCRPNSDVPFLTIYSLVKDHRNQWFEIECENEDVLIPWEVNRGFVYCRNDTLYTMEYHFDAPATHRYLLVPDVIHSFDMKHQEWEFHLTNASAVHQFHTHFRATRKTCPRFKLQMENAEWVESRLYCSVRLEPSKMWHILILHLEKCMWRVLNCQLPSRFWTISINNSNDTLLLCSGYKLCRPTNTIDTEHYNFFRLKIGGAPEKLFQICWSLYSNEIEPQYIINRTELSALMSQIQQSNLNSPFRDDYGEEKRKETGN